MKKEKLSALAIVALIIQASIVAVAYASEEPIRIPGDPGNTQDDSFRVYSNITYVQSLNYSDTCDVYNFTVYDQHWINITFTPPQDSNCSMILRDGDYSPKKGTDRSATTQQIQFKSTADDVWYLEIIFWSEGPGGDYTFRIEPLNFPPVTPEAPAGPAIGYVYNDTSFSAVTTDVENDLINYVFDWDDGTTTWNNSRPSGQPAIAKHQWTRPTDNNKPTYNVKVKAQDEHGNWSAWSTTTSIIVRQNDDNSGNDTSNLQGGARFINPTRFDDEVLTSKGTLYNDTNPMDLNDWYTFPIYLNNLITTTMTPPANVDFDLELWDPQGNSWTSKNPAGQKESITQTAAVEGNWSLRVYIPNSASSGSGQYTFTLSVRLHTLTVKTRVTTGFEITSVKVWIDGVQYSSPVYHEETIGTHSVEVQSYFERPPWLLYEFAYWEDNSSANPRTIYFNGTTDVTITAFYYIESLRCPTLFVWNGTDYVEEGLLNIHAESDVTVQHKINQTLVPNNFVYNLQLRELDEFTSHIDQVKLYAVDSKGKWHVCPLIYAKQESTYVTFKLLFDDEKRIDLVPTETVNLKFLPAIPYKNTAFFVFEINGYNRKIE